MVSDRSRMKHADIAAHSSGRKGGDSRVFEAPLTGVLHMIATATVLKRSFLLSVRHRERLVSGRNAVAPICELSRGWKSLLPE